MEEEIVCNRWRDLAGDSFLPFLFLERERERGRKGISQVPGLSSLMFFLFLAPFGKKGKIT